MLMEHIQTTPCSHEGLAVPGDVGISVEDPSSPIKIRDGSPASRIAARRQNRHANGGTSGTGSAEGLKGSEGKGLLGEGSLGVTAEGGAGGAAAGGQAAGGEPGVDGEPVPSRGDVLNGNAHVAVYRDLRMLMTALASRIPGIRLLPQLGEGEETPSNDSGERFRFRVANPDAWCLRPEDVQLFFPGMQAYVGRPAADVMQAIEREHASDALFEIPGLGAETSHRREWQYAACGNVGSLPGRGADESGRMQPHPWRLDDFVQHPLSQAAGLLEYEVLAVRLWTGPMRPVYNAALWNQKVRAHLALSHPTPVSA